MRADHCFFDQGGAGLLLVVAACHTLLSISCAISGEITPRTRPFPAAV